jgi:hypothetical protein
MRNVFAVVAAMGAIGVVGAGPGIASGAGSKSCQAGFTESRSATQLRVSGDTCANARKVSGQAVGIAPRGCLKVTNRTKGQVAFKKPCVQLSYTCRATTFNQRRSLKVTCTRGSRQIRFQY